MNNIDANCFRCDKPTQYTGRLPILCPECRQKCDDPGQYPVVPWTEQAVACLQAQHEG